MGWDHLFIGFLQAVAFGVAVVLALLLAISFSTSRRDVAPASRKPAH